MRETDSNLTIGDKALETIVDLLTVFMRGKVGGGWTDVIPTNNVGWMWRTGEPEGATGGIVEKVSLELDGARVGEGAAGE